MPYIRKLPSGNYQANVRHPSGKRIPFTDPLKSVVKTWALDMEAAFRRGDLRDPRAGEITVGDWYARWFAARGVEEVTQDKTASLWRTHAGPRWATWPLGAVAKLDAKAWVKELKATPARGSRSRTGAMLSADTVHQAVHVMSSLYRAALDETPPLVAGNPFEGLKGDLPTIPPAPIDFYTHEEAEAIVEAIERDSDRALVEMGFWVGLRPGELFGLHADRVHWLRSKAEVTRVQTRKGLREYPKTVKSHRVVPIRPQTMKRLPALMVGRSPAAPVFLTAEGHLIDDSNFRHRVWEPAIRRAGVRYLAPKFMRHTAASWLVQDGVDLYEVQALLGHESFKTTQRYAHLKPGAHEKVLASWKRASKRTSSRRTSARRLSS